MSMTTITTVQRAERERQVAEAIRSGEMEGLHRARPRRRTLASTWPARSTSPSSRLGCAPVMGSPDFVDPYLDRATAVCS